MCKLVLIVVVLLGSALGLPGKRGNIGLDRSFLSMFDAFQAANGQQGEEEGSGHVYEAMNQYHDGPGEHDHEHNEQTK